MFLFSSIKTHEHYHFLLKGAIAQNSKNKQVLDKLQVERERGITVKAQVNQSICQVSVLKMS